MFEHIDAELAMLKVDLALARIATAVDAEQGDPIRTGSCEDMRRQLNEGEQNTLLSILNK